MYKYEWNDKPPRSFLLEHGLSMLTKNSRTVERGLARELADLLSRLGLDSNYLNAGSVGNIIILASVSSLIKYGGLD